MKISFLFFLPLTLTSFVHAQEEPPLITDRPDQTESASVIPAWRLQVETGLSREWVSKDNDAYDENNRYGSTMLRYGLFNFLEFRLGSELVKKWEKLTGEDPSTDFGASPIGVGFKFALIKENGLIPDIALITSWRIPNTGSKSFSTDKWQHSFVFAFAHTLSENWGLGYNLDYEFEGAFETSAFKYSLVGGYSIADKDGGYSSRFMEARSVNYPGICVPMQVVPSCSFQISSLTCREESDWPKHRPTDLSVEASAGAFPAKPGDC